MSKKEIRKHIISIISVSLFLIIMTTFVYLPKQENLLSSFAFLQMQRNFYIEELTEAILLRNAAPTKDSKALENDPYRFKVVNKTNKDITYKLVFKGDKEKAREKGKELLPHKYLRYVLYEEGSKEIIPTTLSDDGILYEATIPSNSEVTFEFKMWLDYEADNGAMNKIFIGRVELERIEK